MTYGYIRVSSITQNIDRQMEGIKIAKAKGIHLGRPKAVLPKKFSSIKNKFKNSEISAVEACKILNMKKSTFYKYVKYEEV